MARRGRKLRNLRAPEAIRAFERLGYAVLRTKGSHYVLKHAERGMLVLPFHRGVIKTGIIMDALKKARVSIDQFEEHL